MKELREKEITVIIIADDDSVSKLPKTISSVEACSTSNCILTNIIVIDATTKGVAKVDSKVKNQIIKKQHNEFMGAALNRAVDTLSTQFVSFFGSGDFVSTGFFEKTVANIKKHKVRFASVESFCFVPSLDREEKSALNKSGRFLNDAAVSVEERCDFIQTTANATVFLSSVFKERMFNANIKYEYYQDYMMKLLLDNPVYGVVSGEKYNFFKPQEDNALYHINTIYKDWYIDSLADFLIPLMECSQQENGELPLFISFYIMYYFQARFLANMNNRNKRVMTDNELKAFFAMMRHVLKKTNDGIILNKNRFPAFSYSLECALMFKEIKSGSSGLNRVVVEDKNDAILSINETDSNVFVSRLSSMHIGVHVLDYTDGRLTIDGSFRNVYIAEELNLYALFNGKKYTLENNDRYSLTKYFGISAYKKFTFHLELPLDSSRQEQKLQFFAKVGSTVVPLNYSFLHHWAKLAVNPEASYWCFNRYIAKHSAEEKAIIIEKSSRLKKLKSELKFLPQLFRESKKYFLLRLLYDVTIPFFKNKKIWLMYDKLYKGGDSCEYLYRATAKNNDGITKYYIIDKNTSDYKSLKADGYKPVATRSIKHRLAFLHSDIVLITNSNLFPFNGYNMDRSRFIRGLCNFGSMCLQHGLTVQKCAMAQQRIIDNTKMYFIASKYEKGNLEHHAYNYKGFDIIKLTGIGRYDGLKNNDQKQILLSPTWRMYNAMPVTSSEGVQREYNPEFKYTVYYKIYNDLINNEKLLNCAKKNGYKIKYLLHPILSAQLKDFKPGDGAEVIASVGDLSYEKILTESSLMVTDYSGVQFDFAYMKKPLVYFHPSQLPAHYDDGCFFYDTMGFGEICTESEQLVDTLCAYMENGCKMSQKYIDRVDDFYNFHDHNNCERIYKEILNFQKQVDRDKMRTK
ncbi:MULTISPECIES: CDP-glycerol glycerophosphotransferase family protein [unclassified Ruminococcus]|uniref:CDP-glycerol glycerophosphotransferase family protein n=1 Tax=unclassified Ruminococcus TaxID=2608920 RepID=UPI00210E2055|nr:MULTISPECIES: CDP-glycerol glycerophosphotransferase family protein [unclassified Ruminococcus]MCQ4022573.1 teichoic acid biosynthesis protein [Ruminococcus sp. zg-924]MCQ4114813.1 teichoic acid biosynthesis protein [Ruminococcus sp. zg-921]